MLKIYKHRLPHWNLEGAYYFITFKTNRVQLTEDEIKTILDIVKNGASIQYRLFAVQVMPDHVHIILKPINNLPLSKIMQWIKGVSARAVNKMRYKTGYIWMIDYYDRIIRNENDFNEKLRYIYENPVRAGLVERPEDYLGWFLQNE